MHYWLTFSITLILFCFLSQPSYPSSVLTFLRFMFTHIFICKIAVCFLQLTFNPLTWKIRWAPNNADKSQMGYNSAFKGVIGSHTGRRPLAGRDWSMWEFFHITPYFLNGMFHDDFEIYHPCAETSVRIICTNHLRVFFFSRTECTTGTQLLWFLKNRYSFDVLLLLTDRCRQCQTHYVRKTVPTYVHIQVAAFNVTYFYSRITHIL